MSAPTPPADPAARGARVLLAALLGAQVVVLVGFAGFYLYELILGESADPARVVMSVVLILVTAAGLAAVARGWVRLEHWPRTPTLVWSVLLLPVAWGLFQGGLLLVGAAVGLIGLGGVGGALATPARPAPDEPD